MLYKYSSSTWNWVSNANGFILFAEMRNVDCFSTNLAYAIGYHNTFFTPLIYKWDGTAWAQENVSSLGLTNIELSKVKIVAANNVIITGRNRSTNKGFVIKYDGSSWAVMQSVIDINPDGGILAV